MATDWGDGTYELTAAELHASAKVLVSAARIASEHAVLDVGCGTGNAALLAAESGAQVTGIDPAKRLLDVARESAQKAGLSAHFLEAEAGSLPFADQSFDRVLSHFALIFAPDATAAIVEIARVLRADGVLVFSAWLPEGQVFDTLSEFGRMVAEALPEPAPPRFAWGNQEALAELLTPHFRTVSFVKHSTDFEAPSAAEYVDSFLCEHPMGRGAARLLESAGRLTEAREKMLESVQRLLAAPGKSSMSSPYVVVTASGKATRD